MLLSQTRPSTSLSYLDRQTKKSAPKLKPREFESHEGYKVVVENKKDKGEE